MAQCWPFTYKQKLQQNDKRTVIDVKGALTLFLKWCKAGSKYLFASAFRNGSESVATAVSTMHTRHQWEGVALKPSELREYKDDKMALVSKFFQRMCVIDYEYKLNESRVEKRLLNEILTNQIEPFTLRQGTYHH